MVRRTTGLDENSYRLLDAKKDATGKTAKELASEYISKGILWNLQDEGWEKRIAKSLEEIEEPTRAKRIKADDCPALAQTKEAGFVCCRNAPTQKKLGNGESADMLEVCGACVRVKGIIEERDLLREQVKAVIVVDIPSCIHGGRLSDDGKKMYCKNSKMDARFRSVDNWCKKLKKGANCDGLRWSRVEAQGKFGKHER